MWDILSQKKTPWSCLADAVNGGLVPKNRDSADGKWSQNARQRPNEVAIADAPKSRRFAGRVPNEELKLLSQLRTREKDDFQIVVYAC